MPWVGLGNRARDVMMVVEVDFLDNHDRFIYYASCLVDRVIIERSAFFPDAAMFYNNFNAYNLEKIVRMG